MIHSKKTYIVCNLLISLLLIGCSTPKKFHYVSGKKAQDTARGFSDFLKEVDGKDQRNKDGESAFEGTRKSLDAFTSLPFQQEGIDVTFVEGESKQDIIGKVGKPSGKITLSDDEDIWKYDFCDVYFKSDRLTDVKFH